MGTYRSVNRIRLYVQQYTNLCMRAALSFVIAAFLNNVHVVTNSAPAIIDTHIEAFLGFIDEFLDLQGCKLLDLFLVLANTDRRYLALTTQ